MDDSAAAEAAPPKDYTTPHHSSATNSDGYFDCNICLDLARDPVVTICGHLYCCLCISKWLLIEDDNFSPQSCPVCKASLSPDSLVHLCSRGSLAKRRQQHSHRRPAAYRHQYDGDEFEFSPAFSRPRLVTSSAGGMHGEMAVTAAIAGGLFYSRQEGAGGGSRLSRQEAEVERWLNQIWVFMLCGAFLCLALF